MNKILSLCFVFLISLSSSFAQDAKEIIQKLEEKQRGQSSYIEMKMTIVRPTWKREITMKSWSKDDEYSLILITGPARDKGVAYLKRKREMWNWQPSIDRVVKMPPSMMTQSWMGSDFTNDDLVRQSSMTEDYTHKILGSKKLEGRDCYKIQLTPKASAAVVWGKVLIWVDKKEHLQLKVEFYDEDDYLVNTMLGKNIRTIGGRVLATRMEIIPAEEEGHKTIMEYISAKFDHKIPDQTFSIQYMKRVR